MDEHPTIRPARSPARTRPGRHRRHERPELPHHARRVADDPTEQTVTHSTQQDEPQTAGGGGSSGRGRRDDDDGGRRPDRDGDDALRFLIALGIIAVGAGVMGARLLTRTGRTPHIF